MFASLLKAVEPHLKALSHRVTSPWKGNHVVYVSADSIISLLLISPNYPRLVGVVELYRRDSTRMLMCTSVLF